MSDERRCAFVHSRHCYVEVDNIPLDVCQLCIEAWRIDRELTARETQYSNIAQLQSIRTPSPSIQASEIQQTLPKPEIEEKLRRLDQLFLEDSVDPQEYVRRRTEILGNASPQSQSTTLTSPTPKMDSIDTVMHSIRVMVVEKKLGGYKIDKLPGDWDQPEFLNTRFIDSLFQLTGSLAERQKITIQIDRHKLAILSYSDSSIILLMLNEDESVEEARNEALKVSPRLDVESLSDAFKELGKAPSKPLSKPLP